MGEDEKLGVSIMLGLLAIGLIFIETSGRWKLHEINPIRILLAEEDGTLRTYTKPVIWCLIAVALANVWLFTSTR